MSTVAVLVLAVMAAVTLQGGGDTGGEVFLQTASAAGPDAFTASTVSEDGNAASTTYRGTPRTEDGGTRTFQVDGSYAGLYGGSRNVASCDVEKQITFLGRNGTKAKAFAGALGIRQSAVPAYLRSLTPAHLTWDTRVTNHGYRNGATTDYQAVLQAGTAVLVDNRGVPRVRCACGNPLTTPVAVKGEQQYTGRAWPTFRPSRLVAVAPADEPLKAVTMYDQGGREWFKRPSGDAQGSHDQQVDHPDDRKPGSAAPTLPPPTSPSLEESPDEGRESGGHNDGESPDGGRESGGHGESPDKGRESGGHKDEESPDKGKQEKREAPPADRTPSAGVSSPPGDQPPGGQPPGGQPPGGQPPGGQPPGQPPPADQPPGDQPRYRDQAPPADQPPTGGESPPSGDQPHGDQPPADQPPSGGGSSQENQPPPAHRPPADQPH
ncbi:DUF6777 domain-containing protein [Streptomyces sp. NPDC059165]|uniref:DUF6777 domain-containing protein n=1 Tax=Streptomyces sp. NPDC059165 TaxID=3346751 RepID=UPI00369E54FD